MEIIVCLKQVPGTTEVKIDPETNTLIRQGIKNVVNPFDSYALEEGIRIREKLGGKVTVFTMGPPQAEEMLREAISLGADAAVLLSDREFAGADTWATAYTLAAAVKKAGECGLVICGRQSIDGDTGQVGPEMAEMLGLPFIAYVSAVEEISETNMTVRRMVEEGHEVLETKLPALMTVTKEINLPRLPSLRGKMNAKKAEIPVWTAADLPVEKDKLGLSGSFTQVTKIFFPKRASGGQMLEGEPAEKVEKLVAKLKSANLI
ncbi:electron transfer flavoprotein subunit beta/FixA family protein [Chloroflexota bacterium]